MNFLTCRYLSKKDIKVIAGCGCPSTDRKVVNSGKRLRAYVGIDEGNVCIPHSPLYVAFFFVVIKFNLFLDSYASKVSFETYLTKLKHLLSRCVALVT